MLYITLTLMLFLPCVYLKEIVTFQNKEYYLCSVDSTANTIYTEPPSLSNDKNSSILIEDNDLWPSDWALKSSTQVVVPGVIDKRWEDFGTIYTDAIALEAITFTSFSVKSSSVDIVVSSPEKNKTEKNPETLNDGTVIWQHFATNAVNKSAFSLNATTPTDVYWKIHDYKMRYATTVSENATVLLINPSVATCVNLYFYLCEKCNISVLVGNALYNLEYAKNKWQTLEMNLNQQQNVTIKRSTTDKSKTGEWFLDIRKCSNRVEQRATYKIELAKNDTENRTCHTFISDTKVSKKESLKAAKTIFECKAGTLGKDCDINCEEFLGKNYTKCEKHKICDDSNSISQCFCAWGYKGLNCDENCSDGTWGLSCQNKCDNCNKCDKVTGECNGNGSEPAYFIKSLLFIPLLTIFKTLNLS